MTYVYFLEMSACHRNGRQSKANGGSKAASEMTTARGLVQRRSAQYTLGQLIDGGYLPDGGGEGLFVRPKGSLAYRKRRLHCLVRLRAADSARGRRFRSTTLPLTSGKMARFRFVKFTALRCIQRIVNHAQKRAFYLQDLNPGRLGGVSVHFAVGCVGYAGRA